MQLDTLSKKTNLIFSDVSIRDQQTRWGSCSANKVINLNFRLIFLPAHLVEHILIHELCHTKYLNHSEKFWHLVAKHDHAYLKHKQEIRQANQYVPVWI